MGYSKTGLDALLIFTRLNRNQMNTGVLAIHPTMSSALYDFDLAPGTDYCDLSFYSCTVRAGLSDEEHGFVLLWCILGHAPKPQKTRQKL